jgi:hypothetical protein
MAWHDDYGRSQVPGGILPMVPPTAVPDGARRGIAVPYVSRWIIIENTGDADLWLAWSEAALDAGTPVYWLLKSGRALTLSAAESIRHVWVEAPSGGGAGEVQVMPCYTRDLFGAQHPQITTANGFPAFDASDTDAIVPGVG